MFFMPCPDPKSPSLPWLQAPLWAVPTCSLFGSPCLEVPESYILLSSIPAPDTNHASLAPVTERWRGGGIQKLPSLVSKQDRLCGVVSIQVSAHPCLASPLPILLPLLDHSFSWEHFLAKSLDKDPHLRSCFYEIWPKAPASLLSW